jgi:hypothetical protein
VLFALLLGATAAVLPGCSFCHQSQQFVSETAAHQHAKVDCVRCHVGPGVASRVEFAYRLIFGMTLRLSPGSSGPISSVPDATCLSCHEHVTSAIVTSNGISIKHSDCAKGRRCVECHSDTAHGKAVKWIQTYTMNTCLDCHSTVQARTNCTLCHAGRSQQQLLATDEWSITHGPNWKQAHGMGDLHTCGACHVDTFCARCHGIPLPHSPDFIKLHPISALSSRASCTVCHKQTFCDNCHGLPMPHPPTFTPQHPMIVKARGQQLCLHCHLQDDCTNCHLKHVHPGGATTPPVVGP